MDNMDLLRDLDAKRAVIESAITIENFINNEISDLKNKLEELGKLEGLDKNLPIQLFINHNGEFNVSVFTQEAE